MNTPIDRRLTNDSIYSSDRIKIIRHELYDSSSRDLYYRFRIGVATESVQPIGPQFMNHWLPTIDTLEENTGIWSPLTNS